MVYKGKIFIKKEEENIEQRFNFILNSLLSQKYNIEMYLRKSIGDDCSNYYILIDLKDLEVIRKTNINYSCSIYVDPNKSIYNAMKIFGMQVYVVFDFDKDPIIVKDSNRRVK